MPELPEVETTRRAIAPLLKGRIVTGLVRRTAKLRFPLAAELPERMRGCRLGAVTRRGKYLLFASDRGTLLLHLGMSGHLRLLPAATPAGKHDHLELQLDNGTLLRLTDPRKFATVLWLTDDPHQHPLLAGLGPEPLTTAFSAEYLYRLSRGRRQAVKPFIMNSRIVVGVGNIYANEALFRARINPALPVGELDATGCRQLVDAIRRTLEAALAAGGTTLRDYVDASGTPGYFRLQLQAYGREGEACGVCGTPLAGSRLGGRSTCWCPHCQPLN